MSKGLPDHFARPSRRTVLKLGALASVAGLTGCGPNAAGAGDAKSVTIVNTGSNSTLVLQELLQAQNYFSTVELTAKTQNVSDGSKLIASLLNGSNDLTLLSGFGQVLPAIEKGAKLKIVSGSGLLLAHAVYAKSDAIKSAEDLVGKTIGTGPVGALLHQIMVAFLAKKGIKPEQVKFVNIGSSADVFKAIAAGKVDAGPSLVDVYDEQDKFGVHAIAELWKELPEYTYQGAYTSDTAISKRRDVLVRSLAAYAKLFRYISSPDSKDAYLKAYQKAVPNSDPKEAGSLWTFAQQPGAYAVDLVLDEERIKYMQELNVAQGVQSKVLPFDQVADMSIASDAVKML
ncbi:ABC transporter substrate-binding protein [Kribbella sp. NPDC049227]|uniref:ABC transporter substrate-binding protein n=1 Tax=Kribbella sp. NPDC049227 TaxID=3364113 RepID=UPI00371CC3FA